MAIRPDYQTGTIDLVASSADFTTTGAALQIVAVQPGDAIITPSGHVLIIATITGQNSGTLFLPCPPAAAGTGLALRIRFQPDGSRYQGAVRNLIDLLSSGNVEAFGELVGAAGMVPIFTGVGTMDLADPATFGIQDPNGSLGKLAALTLAANKILRTDASSNVSQGDISDASAAALALTGDADRLPYFTSASTADVTPLTDAGRAGINTTGTAAADTLAYNTSAVASALTPITPFARTVLDDSTAAEALGTLGGQTNLGDVSAVELGQNLSGDRATYIDFHAYGGAGTLDRSARLVRNPGVNGTFQMSNSGSGTIMLSAEGGVTIPNGRLSNQAAYDSTTTSAANVFITSGALFGRSTSSGVYKTDVEDLDNEHRDLIMQLRPVWYRSLCTFDNPEWSYYGLIAEEVAEIDPRLVHWQTSENVYEDVVTVVTVDEVVTNGETGEKTVVQREKEIVEQVRTEVELETPRPVGVMYDRLVPHLIAKIQELTARLDALESGPQ